MVRQPKLSFHSGNVVKVQGRPSPYFAENANHEKSKGNFGTFVSSEGSMQYGRVRKTLAQRDDNQCSHHILKKKKLLHTRVSNANAVSSSAGPVASLGTSSLKLTWTFKLRKSSSTAASQHPICYKKTVSELQLVRIPQQFGKNTSAGNLSSRDENLITTINKFDKELNDLIKETHLVFRDDSTIKKNFRGGGEHQYAVHIADSTLLQSTRFIFPCHPKLTSNPKITQNHILLNFHQESDSSHDDGGVHPKEENVGGRASIHFACDPYWSNELHLNCESMKDYRIMGWRSPFMQDLFLLKYLIFNAPRSDQMREKLRVHLQKIPIVNVNSSGGSRKPDKPTAETIIKPTVTVHARTTVTVHARATVTVRTKTG
eukprot:g2151.t1